MLLKFSLIVVTLYVTQIYARPDLMPASKGQYNNKGSQHMHPTFQRSTQRKYNPEEETKEFWITKGKKTLTEQLGKQPRTSVAKNVIMFLGDGMSIPTLAAARTYLGQKSSKPGEETELSFEKFPFTGLSKTYCVNSQVADSACSATAYLCGVKANDGTIGVTAAVPLGECDPMTDTNNHVYSIGRMSQLAGKRTGVVTTTRITHASPSGVYAHTAHRDWESDSDVTSSGADPTRCRDIAHQLINGETGENLNVILGGGQRAFIPNTENDINGKKGWRTDGINLINEWKRKKEQSKNKFVQTRNELISVPDDTEYLFGLFHGDHIPYNLERDATKVPSLAEMTQTAIRLLSQGDKGFFLFVEGGRIDHAHHETWARKALEETVEFHKAIQAAADMTDIDDTLIVVTSDHAHTLSVSGYPSRGNDILGVVGYNADDDLAYATLSYANGPGYRAEVNGQRRDMTKENLNDINLEYPAMVPLSSETHGGDDVGIFARGPWAHLLTGVVEQNFIPYVMSYASCVADGDTACTRSAPDDNSNGDGSSTLGQSLMVQMLLGTVVLVQALVLIL